MMFELMYVPEIMLAAGIYYICMLWVWGISCYAPPG